MAKAKGKNAAKGGGVTGKKTSASKTQKRTTSAAPAKTAKKRSRRAHHEESEDDEEERDDIESAEEVEEPDDDGDSMDQSQEMPEQIESSLLETQQKDEMAELKARLEAKRMQKLKKTMNSRVSQFDEIFAEGMEEIKKAERGSAGKELKKKSQILQSFLASCMHEQDDQEMESLEDVVNSLKGSAKKVNSACHRLVDRDLVSTAKTLVQTRAIIASRTKRFSKSAQRIGDQVNEELNEVVEKARVQLDARKFLQGHFKTMAKFGASA